MPIRKTETRIPVGSAASDLGEAFGAADSRCALVSFITSPLVVNRENTYVVFVTDAGLAAQAQSFEWSFSENGGTATTQSTQVGETVYSPQGTGSLSVTVRILDGTNAEQAKLSLTQAMVPLHPGLEALIAAAKDQPGPGASDPDVSRELVNDYNPYYQAVSLPTPETGDAFQQFVFSLLFEGASKRSPADRKQLIEDLAEALDSAATDDLVNRTAEGVGVCNIRLPLLAMIPPTGAPPLPWTELPQPAAQNQYADQQLRQKFAALDQSTLIDSFNLARFPKSNITQCAHIIGALRDHYFAGTNFSDVLTGMSGTRAFWIAMHFRQGPLITS
jgi:PKD repeat protein